MWFKSRSPPNPCKVTTNIPSVRQVNWGTERQGNWQAVAPGLQPRFIWLQKPLCSHSEFFLKNCSTPRRPPVFPCDVNTLLSQMVSAKLWTSLMPTDGLVVWEAPGPRQYLFLLYWEYFHLLWMEKQAFLLLWIFQRDPLGHKVSAGKLNQEPCVVSDALIFISFWPHLFMKNIWLPNTVLWRHKW